MLRRNARPDFWRPRGGRSGAFIGMIQPTSVSGCQRSGGRAETGGGHAPRESGVCIFAQVVNTTPLRAVTHSG